MSAQKKTYQRSKTDINIIYDIVKDIDVSDLNPEIYRKKIKFSFRNDSGKAGRNTNMRSVTNQSGSKCIYFNIELIDDNGSTIALNFLTPPNQYEKTRGGVSPPDGSEEYEQLKAKNPNAKPRIGNEITIFLSEIIEGSVEKLSEDISIPFESTRKVSSDAVHSKLFGALHIVCRVFEHDANLAAINGENFIKYLIAKKKENKEITPQAALDMYKTEYPEIYNTFSLIISDNERKELQKSYQKGIDILLNDILVVPSKEIHTCVSDDTISTGDKPLLMRYIKLKIPHEKDGSFSIPMYDINESNRVGKLTKTTHVPVPNSDEEESLSYNNLHRVITPHTYIGGMFYTGGCVSQFGISFTLKPEKLTIFKQDRAMDADDDDLLWEAPAASVKASEDIPTPPPKLVRSGSIIDSESNDLDSEFDIDELNSAFSVFGTSSTMELGTTKTP